MIKGKVIGPSSNVIKVYEEKVTFYKQFWDIKLSLSEFDKLKGAIILYYDLNDLLKDQHILTKKEIQNIIEICQSPMESINCFQFYEYVFPKSEKIIVPEHCFYKLGNWLTISKFGITGPIAILPEKTISEIFHY